MVWHSTVLALAILASVAVSLLVVNRLDPSGGVWGDRLRTRFVMGIPWGTIVVVGFVLSTYLVVQDGISNWHEPVTIPFRAWSYRYPLGLVTAPFSHASSGHLAGNLIGTILLAPIAEYAWGHYPRERGSQSFVSPRTNPWIRALVIFPLATILVGLLTGIFALGPVIGFSGVVYAYAGFAIVRYPITTLVAAVAAQSAMSTAYLAILRPISLARVETAPPAPPSWAQIAIQGHAFGLLVGLLLGLALLHLRSRRPTALRLWVAVVLFAFTKGLWAVYWFRGEETYVLYRGPGVVLVTALALLVTATVVASDSELLGGSPSAAAGERRSRSTRQVRERIASLATTDHSLPNRVHSRLPALSRDDSDSSASTGSVGPVTRRQAGAIVLALLLALVAGPAIPTNMFVVDGAVPGNETVTVGDYTVTYAEGVENQLISVFDVEAFGENTSITTSGVIVVSERRHIWTDAISANRLAFDGTRTVHVGGPGWRGSVTAIREGWSAAGGDTAYQVWLEPDDGDRRPVFASEPAQADARVEGRNVSIVPDAGSFLLVVDAAGSDSTTRVSIPGANETAIADGIEFTREGGTIYASTNDTRVPIASRERYRR